MVWDHEVAGSNPVTPRLCERADEITDTMKSLLAVGLALAIAAAAALYAQSPSPNSNNTPVQAANAQISAALAAPSPSATAPIEPPSLIPQNILPAPGALPKIPPGPDLEQLSKFFKQTSLGKAADEHRLEVQTAMLETQIRNDADLHAAKAAALRAPTDLERRHLLKHYYELYYGKLKVLADTPDLQAYIDAQKAAHQVVLLQPRVRHETDEPKATALNTAKAGASIAPVPTPVQAKANAHVKP